MKTTFITKLLPAIVALYLVSEAFITVEAKARTCSRSKPCKKQECCVTASPKDNKKICKPKPTENEKCGGKYHCGCRDDYVCKAAKKGSNTNVCKEDDKAPIEFHSEEWDPSSSEEMTFSNESNPWDSSSSEEVKKTTSKPNPWDSGSSEEVAKTTSKSNPWDSGSSEEVGKTTSKPNPWESSSTEEKTDIEINNNQVDIHENLVG